MKLPRNDQWMHVRSLEMLAFCLIALTSIVHCFAASPEAPVSFVNDVMPVLTKAGCNAGVCHAKAGGGQNGFQLSLLGFEPEEDYRHLVLEGRGRRLFPLDPRRSLLLSKASGDVPHGGGIRLKKDSANYQTLLRWIESGTPYRIQGDVELVSVRADPTHGTLNQGNLVHSNRLQPSPMAPRVMSHRLPCSNRMIRRWRRSLNRVL